MERLTLFSESLSSYGFRGEALSSLCNTAQVTVTTKTDQDDVATCYTYDHNGQVICSKISHISKGNELYKNTLTYSARKNNLTYLAL